MSKTGTAARGGWPIASILGLIFITLKLCHQIDWSWVWVLSPFWIFPVAILAFFAIVCVIGLIVSLL